MMKRLLYILALLAATGLQAQQSAPQAAAGDPPCPTYITGYPYFYCECHNTSQEFHFPLETAVTDTMWFSTTVNDLKQGLSAYWFSNCSVTIEVYAFCSSKMPTIRMTVGANQMQEKDVAEINRLVDKMGKDAELMFQTLTPRVRVYPNGGTGYVYCYPYDQGPASTCESPLAVIPRMTYVCDKEEQVYELKPARISSTGRGFIRWYQKNNAAGTIRLTEGACDGPEIANAVLTDSNRVMILDSLKMKALKKAGSSVFVHVSHPAGYVGRMVYRNNIIWDKQYIDTTLCQGKYLQVADTVLKETTVYTKDTLWTGGDTLSLTTYDLKVNAPELQYDTLRLKAAQLPRTYRNQYIPKDGWGDYDFTIHMTNTCDERWLVHVEHDSIRKETIVDSTLCLGKTYTYNNVTYSSDTTFRDSSWVNPDTWEVGDITLRFTEPELEYDTVTVRPSQMTASGYWYSNGDLGVMLKGFGDTLIVKTKKNTCTRWINMTVVMGGYETRVVNTDSTLCMGKTFTYNKKTYAADTVFSDSLWASPDVWEVGHITLHFTEPELEYDTLTLLPSQMTASGYRYDVLGVTVKDFGDTLVIKTKKEECTRWINLTVLKGEEKLPDPPTGLDGMPSGQSAARKYMRDGIWYIRREGQDYDLFGRPINQ